VEFLPDEGHAVPCESGATMQRRPRRNHTPAFNGAAETKNCSLPPAQKSSLRCTRASCAFVPKPC